MKLSYALPMRRYSFALLSMLMTGYATLSGGVAPVYSPAALNANGTVDLGALGATGQDHWFVPPKTLGVTGIPTLSVAASMYSRDAEFARTDGALWGQGFDAATKLLSSGASDTPVQLILSRPVYGIGFHIDNDWPGSYAATMAVYDTKDVLLGTFTAPGTSGAGYAAPFFGVLSTDLNIKRVVVSTSGSSGMPDIQNDFAIDAPIINGQITQQPIITALTNNYSYILPGLPNYGIAQGSIFLMYGFNIGPTSLTTQGLPLQKTLAGVQINVTVGGTTTQAIPYYVYATQIAAILPSATPVGDGTITVTYNGQPSAAAPIHVVASAPGILAVTGAIGPAQATDLQYRLLNYTNSANPQEIVTFWGSGLGAVTGDETKAGTPVSLANVPLEVYMGGKTATVQWAGRSAYPGLDQINVYVPSGVEGCNVGVFFKVGNMVGNTVTVPLAASGRTCTGNTPALNGDRLQSLVNGGSLAAGILFYYHIVEPSGDANDYLLGGFGVGDPKVVSIYQTYLQQVYYGSCQVHTASVDYSGNEVVVLPTTLLDAGPSITWAANPGTTIQVYRDSEGSYNVSTATPASLYSGTTFTFSTLGGKDVGPFTTTLPVGVPPTWTNMSNFSTVDRTQPVTVNWTGGPAGGWAIVTGSSYLADPVSPSVTTFACLGRVEDRSLTVPAYVLAALPPSPSSFLLPATLSLQYASAPVSFSATGLKLGLTQASVATMKQVTYK